MPAETFWATHFRGREPPPGTLTAAPLKITTALNAAELLEAGRR